MDLLGVVLMQERSPGGGLLVIERILRDRAGIWSQIIEERGLRELIVQMLVSSGISLALYGAVLGASYGWQQALSSFVKLPLLFLVTLCICLPTLYLFNLVFGARLSVVQAVALILVAITVTAVLTLAFAPISLFFLVTAQSYAFFKLLNVAILMLSAIVGLRFLIAGMRALNEYQEMKSFTAATKQTPVEAAPAPALVPVPVGVNGAVPVGTEHAPPEVVAAAVAQPAPVVSAVPMPAQPPMVPPALAAVPFGQQPFPRPVPPPHAQPRQASMGLLYIWILLFGFVGTQLGWTLRPFFGDPGQPFGLFRHLSGTFYGDILNTIGQLLGVSG
ncbi:hypothetical protein [Rugosimonospora africana]|nr:hypothetical protein [Rugosimonospora africana]